MLVDGLSVGARTSYEFTNVQADHTISASFAVDMGPTVTITSPTGGEAWRRGSIQVIRWTLSAPVSAGRFTVWASSPGGDLTQLTPPGSAVTAVAGSTDYQWSYTVALPAAATYQILVRYESDAGEVQSEARSSGRVTVTSQVRISVTKPSGAVTWRQGVQPAGPLESLRASRRRRLPRVGAERQGHALPGHRRDHAGHGRRRRHVVLGALEGERAARQGLPHRRRVLVGRQEAGQRPEHGSSDDQALAGRSVCPAGRSVHRQRVPHLR